MKAMICTAFGPPEVLQPRDVPTPEPKADQIRVRVRGTSVNYGDLIVRNLKALAPREFNMPFLFWVMARLFSGVSKPRFPILGSEFSGTVDVVGPAVTTFKPGDPVFGYLGQQMGAYAEFLCMPANGCVAPMPANMGYDEAAVVPYGSIMAYELLEKLGIQSGEKLLVVGASGGMGSGAVQLAKHHFGASVTGVCGPGRVEYVRALGADHVIDYTDPGAIPDAGAYDAVYDVLGRGSSDRWMRALKPGGRYLYASFKSPQLLRAIRSRFGGDKRVMCTLAAGKPETLRAVKDIIEAGKLKAIIDRRFAFADLAEAHRHVESGAAARKIAILSDQPGA